MAVTAPVASDGVVAEVPATVAPASPLLASRASPAASLYELEEEFGLLPVERSSRALTPASGVRRLLKVSLWVVGLLLVAIVALMACKHLTGPLLRWLERLPTPLAHVLFLTAYVASAFPVMVGMMVLNLAGGYLFGLAHGLALCLSGGVLGALVATEACRHACRAPVIRLQRDYENLKQVSRVIEGKNGFRIIVMTRLTFVPFGLQNALFSTAKVNKRRYLLATFIGLIPMTSLNVFIGTTLRSMEDVVHGSSTNVMAAASQLLVAALVTYVISVRMKREVLAACQAEANAKRNPAKAGFADGGWTEEGLIDDSRSPSTCTSPLSPLAFGSGQEDKDDTASAASDLPPPYGERANSSGPETQVFAAAGTVAHRTMSSTSNLSPVADTRTGTVVAAAVPASSSGPTPPPPVAIRTQSLQGARSRHRRSYSAGPSVVATMLAPQA